MVVDLRARDMEVGGKPIGRVVTYICQCKSGDVVEVRGPVIGME